MRRGIARLGGPRKVADLLTHMRVLLVNGNVARHNGDVPELIGLGMDYTHHGHEIAVALRLRDRAWSAFEDRYIAGPAKRMWHRVLADQGFDVPGDATVTDMHPGDATSAPERDVPATVRVFPQQPGRRS